MNNHQCAFADRVTIDKVIAAYQRMNYQLFTTGEYNLNLFGIRANENISNTFNDLVCVMYKKNGSWILRKFDATTDPGLYYRKSPLNKNGTAILVPGRYPGGFKIGMHHGSYQALVQNKPLKLYRDNNKDATLDRTGKIYEEMAGINIHRASSTTTSKYVDKWSAGCQVLAGCQDFKDFMDIINKSSKTYGSVFTYILFTEDQFFGS